MTNLRKLLFGIAVLPFLGALAYGSYQGIVTAGQNAANPLYDVPIVNSGVVAQANPLPVTTAVSATLNWSATANGWATIGTGTTLDMSGDDYQYANVYVTSTGTGGAIAPRVGDAAGNFTAASGTRNDCGAITSSFGYNANFWTVPLRGQYFGLSVSSLSSGTASGTVYFSHANPNSCPASGGNYTAGQVSIGASANLVVAARSGVPGTGRMTLRLTNTGANTVFCANGSGVTTATGMAISAGQTTPALPFYGAMYCIAATGTNIMTVEEIY